MDQFGLILFRGGTIEVPEGTKELYIENASINELLLPDSLEVLHISNASIDIEVIVPETCTDYQYDSQEE